MSKVKCLDLKCDYIGEVSSFINDKNPPKGNSGCWCPKCYYSVIIINNGTAIDHYMDDDTLELGKQLLGQLNNKFLIN